MKGSGPSQRQWNNFTLMNYTVIFLVHDAVSKPNLQWNEKIICYMNILKDK